jgi:hypothetical protein
MTGKQVMIYEHWNCEIRGHICKYWNINFDDIEFYRNSDMI